MSALGRIASWQPTRWQARAVALSTLLAIGLLDRTHVELRLAFFYTVPVAYAAWYLGRRDGVVIAVLASMQWLFENLRMPEYGAPLENAVLRLVFFIAVSSLLASMRARSRQQSAVAELNAVSLADDDAQELMRCAARLVVINTGAQRARVLEAEPGSAELQVRAVAGSAPPGAATVRVDIGSPADVLGVVATDTHRRARLTADDRRFLGVVAAVLAQALLRRRLETEAHELRVRHVVEMNDHVVQGLASALYALHTGRFSTAERTVEFTLEAAQKMMRDLPAAAKEGGAISTADLIRAQPAVVPLGEAHTGPAGAARRRARIRVVLADDTATLRSLVTAILDTEAVGEFEVVAEAGDGVEAVQAVATTKPDIVLLDLAMPRLSGLEAIPEIRRESPQTKIVVFSGFHRDQVADEVKAAGADAHMEKGVAPEQLVAILRGVAGRQEHLRVVPAAEPVCSNPPAEGPVGEQRIFKPTSDSAQVGGPAW